MNSTNRSDTCLSPAELNDVCSLAKEAALLAGEEIQRIRESKQISISHKGVRDLVTAADLAAEKQIITLVKKNFPDHRFLSEESFSQLDNPSIFQGPLWIIDPVDGTTNFAHGHVHVGVSIAFAYNGEVLFGIVHAPFLKETFMARKGQGATLNQLPISVRQVDSLEQSLIATGFPYSRDANEIDLIGRRAIWVLKHCRDLRRIGAASLDICWTACGRLDGFYESLMPWDMAAARLIAQEAGARCGHFIQPKKSILPIDLDPSHLLITSPLIYEQLEKILNSYQSQYN